MTDLGDLDEALDEAIEEAAKEADRQTHFTGNDELEQFNGFMSEERR